MGFGGDVALERDLAGSFEGFVGLGWAVEIEIETVLLESADVIKGNGDGLARKSLNGFGDGARGLGGVDDGRGEANYGGHADDCGQQRGFAKEARTVAGEESGGDGEGEEGGDGGGDVGCVIQGQMVSDGDGRGD